MNANIATLISNIEKVIVGKHDVVVLVVTTLLSEGHILIEDVPGVGKTQLVSALSKSVDGVFNRIQMTPDIMPSDVTGFSMLNRETQQFDFKKGSAFCNFLLADEINRASPKSQSSLLEIMEERQVSLDGKTYELPKPFMVLATQNPVETYGTYHLPEAQMDRFTMKISIGYPTPNEEFDIINRTEMNNPVENISSVIDCDYVLQLQKQVKKTKVVDAVKRYIVNIVTATRKSDYVTLGASPRGAIALYKASRAFAFVNGMDYVSADDVRAIAVPVLAHRLIMSPKGKTAFKSSEELVESIVRNIELPLFKQ